MLRLKRGDTSKSFNSLLEMLMQKEGGFEVALVFQFSIGDAIIVALIIAVWIDVFQFSIGDAGTYVRALYVGRHGKLLSILYWRCRVLWSFECVGF